MRKKERHKITDKARLDWLSKNKAGIFWSAGCWSVGDEEYGTSLRATVDKAMRSGGEK